MIQPMMISTYNDPLSVLKAAKILGYTAQALWIQIKKGKIKTIRNDIGKIRLEPQELQRYLDNRWSRNFSTFKGKLRYDKEKGELSVKEAANRLKISINKMYYKIKTNQIPYIKKGGTYVINEKDMKNFRKYLIDEKESKRMLKKCNLYYMRRIA